MSDNQSKKPHKPPHVAVTGCIVFVAFTALYLIGFVVAVKLGPSMNEPASTVLSIVYSPLIKCDDNNIEPFNSAIEWLRHWRRQTQPANGKTMTVPAAPRPSQ